jgi:predicted transcriptional regulator
MSLMFMTTTEIPPELDSKTVNFIENTAIHTAARNDGLLYAAQLMPFFSLSLQTLDNCLAKMVDGSSIIKTINNGLTCYEFRNLSDQLLKGTDMTSRHISYEGEDIKRAKIEHQILYASVDFKGRIHAEKIAASTEFTLSEIKEILKKLSLAKFISENLNEEKGSIYYIFPEIEYFEKNFKDNMQFLRLESPIESFDAKAAVFVKYMFICLIMLCLLFFAKVNFRFLIILFMLSIPLSAIMTYFNYKKT